MFRGSTFLGVKICWESTFLGVLNCWGTTFLGGPSDSRSSRHGCIALCLQQVPDIKTVFTAVEIFSLL